MIDVAPVNLKGASLKGSLGSLLFWGASGNSFASASMPDRRRRVSLRQAPHHSADYPLLSLSSSRRVAGRSGGHYRPYIEM